MPGRLFLIYARPASLLLLVACMATLVRPTDANAQASIAVNRLSDMTFGDVTSGSSTTLLYSDAGASVFRLDCSGMAGFQKVVLTLTLPTQIVNGADTVPVTYGGTAAAWSYTNDPGTATAFDPSSGADIAKNGSIFSVYVWVGATLDPAQSTPSQQYSNTFTLDAEIQ